MDIRTQAYYQQMRQQQVYRAYVAGCGDDPTPPAPFCTFKAILVDTDSNRANLSIYKNDEWEQIQFGQEIKNILQGTTLSSYISCDNPYFIYINGIKQGDTHMPAEECYYSSVLNENTILSVKLV